MCITGKGSSGDIAKIPFRRAWNDVWARNPPTGGIASRIDFGTGLKQIRNRRAREATALNGLLKDVLLARKEVVWNGFWELVPELRIGVWIGLSLENEPANFVAAVQFLSGRTGSETKVKDGRDRTWHRVFNVALLPEAARFSGVRP